MAKRGKLASNIVCRHSCFDPDELGLTSGGSGQIPIFIVGQWPSCQRVAASVGHIRARQPINVPLKMFGLMLLDHE
jgi:hypothetical protein